MLTDIFKKKRKKRKPTRQPLSIQFQKVQFTLFGIANPILEFHAGILLSYMVTQVTAMPIHQFCSTIFCHTLMPEFRVYSNQSINSLFMSLKLLISYWCHILPFFFFMLNSFFSVEETRSFVQQNVHRLAFAVFPCLSSSGTARKPQRQCLVVLFCLTASQLVLCQEVIGQQCIFSQ